MADHIQAQVFEYLSDALEPAEKAAFEAHMKECAACTALVAQKRQFLGALQTSLQAALTAPPELSDLELLNKVRTEHARRVAAGEVPGPVERLEPGLRLLKWMGLGVATAVVILIAGLLYGIFAPSSGGLIAAPVGRHHYGDGGVMEAVARSQFTGFADREIPDLFTPEVRARGASVSKGPCRAERAGAQLVYGLPGALDRDGECWSVTYQKPGGSGVSGVLDADCRGVLAVFVLPAAGDAGR